MHELVTSGEGKETDMGISQGRMEMVPGSESSGWPRNHKGSGICDRLKGWVRKSTGTMENKGDSRSIKGYLPKLALEWKSLAKAQDWRSGLMGALPHESYLTLSGSLKPLLSA